MLISIINNTDERIALGYEIEGMYWALEPNEMMKCTVKSEPNLVDISFTISSRAVIISEESDYVHEGIEFYKNNQRDYEMFEDFTEYETKEFSKMRVRFGNWGSADHPVSSKIKNENILLREGYQHIIEEVAELSIEVNRDFSIVIN